MSVIHVLDTNVIIHTWWYLHPAVMYFLTHTDPTSRFIDNISTPATQPFWVLVRQWNVTLAPSSLIIWMLFASSDCNYSQLKRMMWWKTVFWWLWGIIALDTFLWQTLYCPLFNVPEYLSHLGCCHISRDTPNLIIDFYYIIHVGIVVCNEAGWTCISNPLILVKCVVLMSINGT